MSGRLDGLDAARTGWIRVPKGRKRPAEGRQEGCVRPVDGDALLRGLSPSRTVGDVSEGKPARRSKPVRRYDEGRRNQAGVYASTHLALMLVVGDVRPATTTAWRDGGGIALNS